MVMLSSWVGAGRSQTAVAPEHRNSTFRRPSAALPGAFFPRRSFLSDGSRSRLTQLKSIYESQIAITGADPDVTSWVRGQIEVLGPQEDTGGRS
jgi:hypothetical protein